MELKEKLLSSFIAFEQGLDTNTNNQLHGQRVEALQVFEQKGFPTRKEEAWRFTSLASLLKNEYSLRPKSEKAVEYKDVKKYLLSDTDTHKMVFINGVFSSHLSSTTPEGVEICLLSSALTKPKYKMIIDTYFNHITDKEDSLTALNTAFASEGVFINVPKSTVVSKPIEVLYLATENSKAIFLQPRNLVVAGENAHVQILETHQSLDKDTTVLTNVVTEIFAHKRAIVDYYKMQDDLEVANLIDNTYIHQKQESRVSVHTFSFGGKLTRNNLNFFQEGERIDSTMKGITLIGKKQHVDHYTLVKHNEANCESHQNYKGIYDDQSAGVFNGKIYVHAEAQKIDAFQQNNNVLLSDKASINTKPQLEIFADDVKCSHGCTIGQLDHEAMFYLQQRGIPKKEAKALLLYAFTDEVMESIKISDLKKRVSNVIAQKLGVDMGFDM